MKLRFPLSLQQLLFPAGCALLLGSQAMGQTAGGSQATFKVKGGTAGVQQGAVLGAGPAGVQIQIGAQTLTLPAAMFESFQMAPPPEYAEGYKALTAREYPKALVLIKSVTDKYKGLPTEWAQYSSNLLGDIYVALKDYSKAEAAYNDFKKLYGGSSQTSEIGLARIALEKGDLAGAKARLDPITGEALQEKNIGQAKARAYSQAFLVSGLAKEKEGNLPGALEDYLRTVTIFYHDPAAVNQAQEQADALRARTKDHPVTVP